jgi:hypothetical protein
MEPTTTCHQATDHGESPVHNSRVSQLKRLGIPGTLAEINADRITWHHRRAAHTVVCPAHRGRSGSRVRGNLGAAREPSQPHRRVPG